MSFPRMHLLRSNTASLVLCREFLLCFGCSAASSPAENWEWHCMVPGVDGSNLWTERSCGLTCQAELSWSRQSMMSISVHPACLINLRLEHILTCHPKPLGEMPNHWQNAQVLQIIAGSINSSITSYQRLQKTINFISVWARKDAQGNIRASRTSNWQRSQADSSWHLASQAEDRRRDILNTELAEKTLGWLS